MLDWILDLLLYLLIFGSLTAISFAVVMGLFKIAENIDKVPSILRWPIAPIFAVLFFGFVTAGVRSFIAVVALFWPAIDVGGNIWIYSNLIIPFISSYCFLWGCYMIVPSNKFLATLCYGILWSVFYVLMIYLAITQDYVYASDYLSEIFDIGAGFWSTIAAALAYLGGAAYALNLAWEDDF